MNEKNYKMNKRRLGVFKYAAIGAAVMVLAKIAVILRCNPRLSLKKIYLIFQVIA